ncbi:MAG: hypothetical protein J6S54_02715 [Lentisphaeria bacterium]|nr:hypothetical protein [Lentisphaeria bacterium]
MNSGEVKFHHCRKGDLSGWSRVDSPVNLFETAALFRKDKVRVCKSSSKITSAVTEEVFIKCYFYHTLWSQVRHKLRVSRAKHSTLCALAVKKAGVPTPAPWGFFREYGVMLPIRDYLFTEVLPRNTCYLDQYICDAPEEAAGKIVACMILLHNNGIEHGALGVRNMYIAESGATGVIDLDGCRLSKNPLSTSARIREAARVIASAAKKNTALSLDEFKKIFLELYRKNSGIDLSGGELDSRTNYLYNRRRA